MQEVDKELAEHLDSLGCPALQLAFPWMFGAFVGSLPVSELLHLWDRIIGWDTLLLLPVLAVSVLALR